MLTIKVLGSACSNSKRLQALTHEAGANIGIEADIIKVIECSAIMKYPGMSTPTLVISQETVSAGRVPDEAQITIWLAEAETAKAA